VLDGDSALLAEQERIIHARIAQTGSGWRGPGGYYMPAPADRLARALPCSYPDSTPLPASGSSPCPHGMATGATCMTWQWVQSDKSFINSYYTCPLRASRALAQAAWWVRGSSAPRRAALWPAAGRSWRLQPPRSPLARARPPGGALRARTPGVAAFRVGRRVPGRACKSTTAEHTCKLACGAPQVAAFRTWLDKRGGGGPTPLAAGPLPPAPSKAEIFDRYTQHTQFCPSCMAVRAPWAECAAARACACVLTCHCALLTTPVPRDYEAARARARLEAAVHVPTLVAAVHAATLRCSDVVRRKVKARARAGLVLVPGTATATGLRELCGRAPAGAPHVPRAARGRGGRRGRVPAGPGGRGAGAPRRFRERARGWRRPRRCAARSASGPAASRGTLYTSAGTTPQTTERGARTAHAGGPM